MKGQTPIVSYILVAAIGIGILATAMPWVTNMVTKKQDAKTLDTVYNFFRQIDEKIIDIANAGGKESFTLDVPGKVTVYPEEDVSEFSNSIVFEFKSKVSNIAEGQWIPLNTPNIEEIATLGSDPQGIIFGRSTKDNNEITVEYRLHYRTLYDYQTNKAYKIALKTDDDVVQSTTKNFLRVERLQRRTEVNGQTLTINEIKIIL